MDAETSTSNFGLVSGIRNAGLMLVCFNLTSTCASPGQPVIQAGMRHDTAFPLSPSSLHDSHSVRHGQLDRKQRVKRINGKLLRRTFLERSRLMGMSAWKLEASPVALNRQGPQSAQSVPRSHSTCDAEAGSADLACPPGN